MAFFGSAPIEVVKSAQIVKLFIAKGAVVVTVQFSLCHEVVAVCCVVIPFGVRNRNVSGDPELLLALIPNVYVPAGNMVIVLLYRIC